MLLAMPNRWRRVVLTEIAYPVLHCDARSASEDVVAAILGKPDKQVFEAIQLSEVRCWFA